jgi:hypothetical protein
LLLPLEHAENPGLIFFGNPDAVVLEPKADMISARFGPNSNPRHLALPHELDRVPEQI